MFTDLPDTVRALPTSTDVWRRRFFIVLTILGWLTLAVAIAWGIGTTPTGVSTR